MKEFLLAARALLLDMASMVVFLVVVWLTDDLYWSAAIGMAFGVAQIVWQLVRHKPIEALQWLSLVQILAAGTATLLTDNATFMMLKPSVLSVILGVVMLKRGWMNRYISPATIHLVGDVATRFGFVWAYLMFFTGALNIALALTLDTKTWSVVMSFWGLGSNIALFLMQYAVMDWFARRRAAAAKTALAGNAV
ncbi:MAG TPA: septation protein IspZ [Devosiaceae bacterium]